MKTKNLLLWGLAALGGYALWKRANTKGVGSIVPKGLATKVMEILGHGPIPQFDSSYQDPTQDPLYPEYLAYRKSLGGDIVYGPGQARPEVYIMRFDEWKAKKQQLQSLGGAAGLLINNRVVQGVLQNGTIVAGVGDPLPPNPMELAWDYPGLQSSHAPGRIYKV